MNRELDAYKQGQLAKECQYERVSPYTGILAEKYWYAGYDGIPYKEVKRNG